jgi:tyrosinase
MTNVWSSINDPLFWMHHAQLDRVWALWQSLNEKNIYAIGGPIYPNGTGLMTLEYPVEMASYIAPTLTIRAVMDTRNKNGKGALCYYYQENGQPTP